MYVCKRMLRKYLGFGRERLNPEKSERKGQIIYESKSEC